MFLENDELAQFLYLDYKNRLDSYHYRLKDKITSVDSCAETMSSLRQSVEKYLPRIVLLINLLSLEEFERLYSTDKELDIDDYGVRLKLFELIVDPSEEHRLIFNEFKNKANVK